MFNSKVMRFNYISPAVEHLLVFLLGGNSICFSGATKTLFVRSSFPQTLIVPHSFRPGDLFSSLFEGQPQFKRLKTFNWSKAINSSRKFLLQLRSFFLRLEALGSLITVCFISEVSGIKREMCKSEMCSVKLSSTTRIRTLSVVCGIFRPSSC